MYILAWLGIILLSYIYGGYLLFLKILAWKKKSSFSEKISQFDSWPMVTVIITVHNEEDVIERRITNILNCDYPPNHLEIIIASDGSSDNTDRKVSAFSDPRVRLFRPLERIGKSDTQNRAVIISKGEILVFSDAATKFDNGFLKEIVHPFRSPSIGGATGHLLFIREEGAISKGQSIYWSQELSMRLLESKLGWLAVSSGACLAVRKSLFKPMITTVGEDCLIPLDVVQQGFRFIHVTDAIAFDHMPSDAKREFRTRVRMTLRNWQGTWQYPALLNPFKYGGVAFSLWSHKILRWLSPLFMFFWIGPGLMSLAFNKGIENIPGWSSLLFVLSAILGYVSQKGYFSLPMVETVYSFCLANFGFFIGVIQAISGKKISSYR